MRIWKRDNPEKIKASRVRNAVKNAARVRRWRERNPERVEAKAAEWRERNPERVEASNRRNRERLSDTYVRKLLSLTASASPPDLIEAKREQLIYHRLTKQLEKAINERSKA